MTKSKGIDIFGLNLAVPTMKSVVGSPKFYRGVSVMVLVLLVLITVAALLPNSGCSAVDLDILHCSHPQWAQLQAWILTVFIYVALIVPSLIAVRSGNPNIIATLIAAALVWVLGVGLTNAIDKLDVDTTKFSTQWLTITANVTKNLGTGLGLAAMVALFV